jgi:hypothetical protein
MAPEDVIVMTREELKRLQVVKKVMGKEIKQWKAAELLDLSDRQVRRMVGRVEAEGDVGIVHRLRGKKSNRKLSEKFRKHVLKRYTKEYAGFGPSFAVEKFLELEEIRLSKETLRGWLLEEGLWERQRKGRAHRQWRERKFHFGEMVQMDGSHHDWFEGRCPKSVLMGYIDDATGNVHARFYDYEGTIPAMDSFKLYVQQYGIPGSVYLDKHTTYKSNGKLSVEDELQGTEMPLSEFERACKELGVRVIHADSPQAKGRIERLFRTFQDRLIKEMRLVGISTKEEGNEFLKGYLPKYNRRFRVIPREAGDVHREVPAGINLDRILCVKDQRTLRNDFTVAYGGKLYQVLEKTQDKTIVIEERVDGTLHLYDRNKGLNFKEISPRPKVQFIRRSELPFTLKPKKPRPAPLDHPWRKFWRYRFQKYGHRHPSYEKAVA